MSLQLAEDIIKGRRLKRGEDLSFLLSEDLDELCAGADKIRKELCGNHVDLCSIINGRSGRVRRGLQVLRAVSLSSCEGGRISISGARGDSGGLQAS